MQIYIPTIPSFRCSLFKYLLPLLHLATLFTDFANLADAGISLISVADFPQVYSFYGGRKTLDLIVIGECITEMFALAVLLAVGTAAIGAANIIYNTTNLVNDSKTGENATAVNQTQQAAGDSSTFAGDHGKHYRPYEIGGIAVLAVIIVGVLKCGLCFYYAKRYRDNPENILNRPDNQFAYRNL